MVSKWLQHEWREEGMFQFKTLSVCLFIHLSSVYLSVYVCLFVPLSVCLIVPLSVCLSVLSVCLSVCPSVSVCLSDVCLWLNVCKETVCELYLCCTGWECGLLTVWPCSSLQWPGDFLAYNQVKKKSCYSQGKMQNSNNCRLRSQEYLI